MGRKTVCLILCCLLLTLVGMYAAVCLGNVFFSPGQAAKVFLYELRPAAFSAEQIPPQMEQTLIWNFRVPRVLLGFICGAALAVCGVCMQVLVRNKLADPYVLGVSSCASAAATVYMVLGQTGAALAVGLHAAAFSGALIGTALVYLLSRVNGRTNLTHMLMSGVIISMTMSAVTSLFSVMAPDIYALRGMTFWLTGSLTGAKWQELLPPLVCMGICLCYLLLRWRELNLLAFGEETAGTLGLHVQRMEKALFLVSALLTGVCVSVCGSVGFVGMIVPHIARRFVGADHKKVLPLCALLGGNLVVWADVAARLVAAPDEIPVGIMTALTGVPVFLLILWHGSAGDS
ncbi:MAG: iron ABC transporter permease [Blautia sp.]|nr:iron ABC transporter permease [Blautia sp.]